MINRARSVIATGVITLDHWIGRAFPMIAVGVVILDQATKWWVMQTLPLQTSVPLVPGILRLTHVQNTGSAFSLFRGAGVWLVLVSIVALVAILRYWTSLRQRDEPLSPVLLWGLALPFGGAAGNLIDRVRFRHVVDFIELPRFPVFNIADSAITIGAALLILHFLRQDAKSGVQVSGSGTRAAGDGVQEPTSETLEHPPAARVPDTRTPEHLNT